MLTLERTYNSVTGVPIETLLFEKGHIFICGEITSEKAESVKQQIMYLINDNKDTPIIIHINSPGGEINAGLEIYDIIQAFQNKIYLVCTGQAYSIAAIIMSGGKKGNRFILPNSEMLLHEPLFENKISGNCSSVKAASDRLLYKKARIVDILSNHIGKTKEEIRDAISYENFFTAQKSVDFGMCDKIIDFKKITEGNLYGG